MTEQKASEPLAKDIALSRRRLAERGIFEQAVMKTRMAMAFSDPNLPDCPLVLINPAFSDVTGYDSANALGRNCRFLQGPETERGAIDSIRAALTARQPINQELYNYRRDGSGFWNALFISPIFDDSGALAYFFASQVDVSARQEALRRQAQRVETMGALASGVAHEFNNLMTVVLGSIERATLRAVDDTQKRQLARADWGAQRAGKMAGELLSLARRQAHQSRIIDLNHLIRDFEETMSQVVPDEVRVVIEEAAAPALARLDPDQLELVLLNLIRNAVDAMPQGGLITVAARLLSQPEAASALGGPSAVALVVSDNGVGMPPEVATRATELFFTTKAGSDAAGRGSGLGLFLALEFVDKSGGRLSIDSTLEQGTCVSMVFPRAS